MIEADWRQDCAAIREIRHAVFVLEQGIPGELEWDGRDASCTHALALLEDGHAVGTGRLQADGRIGRMAVRKACRGRGVGTALLACLLECARRQRLTTVYLHARADAQDFYRRAGFSRRGTLFPEAGIAHVEMFKRLA